MQTLPDFPSNVLYFYFASTGVSDTQTVTALAAIASNYNNLKWIFSSHDCQNAAFYHAVAFIVKQPDLCSTLQIFIISADHLEEHTTRGGACASLTACRSFSAFKEQVKATYNAKSVEWYK